MEDLHGKATFAGKPIAYGSIDFTPDAAKEHKGPAGSAEIVDGQYSTRETGRGIVPGPHQVRITAYEVKPPPANPDETVPSDAKPPIFTGYTIAAELAAGEKDFDVPESAKGFNIFKDPAATPSANAP